MTAPAFIPGNVANWCETCQGYTDGAVCPCCAGSAALHPARAWLERKQTRLVMQVRDGRTEIWRESE